MNVRLLWNLKAEGSVCSFYSWAVSRSSKISGWTRLSGGAVLSCAMDDSQHVRDVDAGELRTVIALR